MFWSKWTKYGRFRSEVDKLLLEQPVQVSANLRHEISALARKHGYSLRGPVMCRIAANFTVEQRTGSETAALYSVKT